MLRASSSVVGSRVRDADGPAEGGGSLGIAKCAETAKVAMSPVARTLVKLELRWSKAYGARNAASSSVAVPEMSLMKRPLASTRIDFLSGCGSLATGAAASRLSVKLSRVARASAVQIGSAAGRG